MNKWKVLAAIALASVVVWQLASIPLTLWEFDECLFAAGVEQFEPLRHNPPPPGYPLYIGFGKLVALAAPDAFRALVATSVIALIGGMLAFLLAFSAITNARTAAVATLLLYASPSMLIIGVLPQSDSGAMALLALAIWACARRRVAWCAVLCAAAIGWRLQLSIAVVPMFLAAVVMMRTWRDRFIAIAIFGLACLAWFVPLVIEAGGPASYWNWLSGQARYYANHDADLSRSGHSPAHIALRFIAHPWGPKWLSLPLLAFAALAPVALRWKRREDVAADAKPQASMVPLAVGSLVYLAFALATMDPADAVRYALPSLPFIALLAAIALTRVPIVASLALVYAIGAAWYSAPVLRTRADVASPPVQAARWIAKNFPKNGLVLYDAALWPHASYLLRDWQSMRIDAGLAKHGGNPTMPMVIFADSELHRTNGVTFKWPDTDAYRKLTRQHYGVVSVTPWFPSRRFSVIEGMYAPERTRDGQTWRWLGPKAVIELPRLGATRVKLVFRTPPEYPLPRNRVRVNGALVEVKRNEIAEVIVPLDETSRVTILAEKTFVPARIAGANNRDKRELSVMLTRVEAIDVQPAATQSQPPR